MRKILFLLLLSFAATSTLAQENSDWVTSSELSAKLRIMDGDRLFPGTVEGRLAGARIQYRAQFIPFLRNMDYFYSRWGLSDARYKAATEEFAKAGFTEYSHTTFYDQSGSTVHQATWVMIGK